MRFETQWVIRHWTGDYVVNLGPNRELTAEQSALTRQFLFVLSHGFRSGAHDSRRAVEDLHCALFGGVSNFATRAFGASLGFSHDERILADLERAAESGLLSVARQAPIPITYKTDPIEVVGPSPRRAEQDPEPTPLHYVEIELLGPDDEPMVGEAYKLKLPDGRTLSGRLDSRGRAIVEDIAKPGSCEVSFPNIDAGAW